MKQKTSKAWAVIAVVCVLAAFGFWYLKEYLATADLQRQPTDDHAASAVLTKLLTNGVSRHQNETMLMLTAYESGDMQKLRKQVRQLVDKDFDTALSVFAKLDYTFPEYGMKFPHDIVAEHLEVNFSDEQSMEMLSAHTGSSSIASSIMSLYFDRWFDRDHVGQFNWFKTNPTFNEPVTVDKYALKIGASEKGIEVLRMLDDLPESDLRKANVHVASMEQMSTEQTENFGKYLNELEEVPETAFHPISGMVQSIINNASDDPLEAMRQASEWVEKVRDRKRHLMTLAIAASHVNSTSPEAYQQWLKEHKFQDAEARQEFLELYAEEVEFLSDLKTRGVSTNTVGVPVQANPFGD